MGVNNFLIPDDEYTFETDMSIPEKERIERASEELTGGKVSEFNIEDILTAPLDMAAMEKRKAEMGSKGDSLSEERKKLQSIFKDTDIANSYYDVDENGNTILGYEEVIENGVKVKKPIIQQKVMDWEMELQIEVKLDPSLIGKKDSLGLSPLERKRFDKLKALNKINGVPRTDEEIIAKVRQKSDLDSTIIPDMMVHFVTEKEDEMDDLTNNDRNLIKKLRHQGFYMEPETISGIKKSLRLASKDRTIHAKNIFMYLTQKGLDLRQADEDAMPVYGDMYRKERRPSIPLLMEATIEDMEEIMYDKIRSNHEDKVEAESEVWMLKKSPEARKNLIKYFSDNGEKFFSLDDFRKMGVYFRFYGLHQEDSVYFNPGYVIDPKAIKKKYMKELFQEFEDNTGYSFIDVYKYHWENVLKIKESEESVPVADTEALEYDEDKPEIISDIVDDSYSDIEFE